MNFAKGCIFPKEAAPIDSYVSDSLAPNLESPHRVLFFEHVMMGGNTIIYLPPKSEQFQYMSAPIRFSKP